jgi:hypothetical protein
MDHRGQVLPGRSSIASSVYWSNKGRVPGVGKMPNQKSTRNRWQLLWPVETGHPFHEVDVTFNFGEL